VISGNGTVFFCGITDTRGVAARPRPLAWLAGKSPHHAAQLDGRSEGTLVDFKLDGATDATAATILCIYYAVDTIYGATSLQLAPQHPLVTRLAKNNDLLRGEVEGTHCRATQSPRGGRTLAKIEKHGGEHRALRHQSYNGEKVPIWVANYILMDYGTGAIMSVPAHDDAIMSLPGNTNSRIRW